MAACFLVGTLGCDFDRAALSWAILFFCACSAPAEGCSFESFSGSESAGEEFECVRGVGKGKSFLAPGGGGFAGALLCASMSDPLSLITKLSRISCSNTPLAPVFL